jgi:nucleotide-binding universal stress UspA family protein
MRRQKPEQLLVELSTQAQLMVVGTHGVSRFVGTILGSVSQRVAAHALCPVVVLPPVTIHPTVSAQLIVVGVSPSSGGMSALRFALAEAQVSNADVLALRCWSEPLRFGMGSAGVGTIVPPPFETAHAWEHHLLQECLTTAQKEFPGVAVRSELAQAPADVALVNYSRDAAMLVIGCRHEDGHHASRLGPVTSWLLNNSTAPTVIVGFSSN